MRSIDRRRRRQASIVVGALLLVVGASTWLATRGSSDGSPGPAGDPSAASAPAADGAGQLRELWSAAGVGPGDLVASSGDVILPAGDLVLVAEGFGSGSAEPTGRITALARDSGDALWSAELGGPAFLQGTAGGIVVANTQHERIVGLDVTDGEIRWDIALSDVGLEGYGAVTSAITESVSAIGVSATFEGDTRAPVVLGVDTATGELLWTTPLVEGTDLMFGTPPVNDHHAVFTSTLSHPGSAEENVAALLDLVDGSVVWTVGMGGSQGFSDHPAIINGPYVHLPAHPDVLTVDLRDGEQRWARNGYGAALVDDGLWLLTYEGTLELVDPATGDVLRSTETPTPLATQLIGLGDGTLGVVSSTELVILDSDAKVGVRHRWPNGLSAAVRSERGELFVAGVDGTVAAYGS